MRYLIFTLTALLSCSALSQKVDNFVLLDHQGDAHELYYHKSAAAIVVLTHSVNCPDNAEAMSALQTLQTQFKDQDVRFFMLNSSVEDTRATLAASADLQGVNVPILDDETQLIGESLQLTRAGEVLLIDPKTWRAIYRSNLSSTSQPTISNAIAALTNGQPVTQPTHNKSGCAIDLAHNQRSQHANISYTKTIAPLLQQKCVMCHTEGGLGPWAMSSYTMVQGFAPMIREVVRTKRMPPWQADPHIGVWKNDISLSTEETQQLVHWIEAGAPRGSGPDPLANSRVSSIEWPLGQPDLILDIPAYTVPASGVVDYQFPTVKNPLDTGVWVKAATVVPGDREVVHHILAGTQDSDTTQMRRDSGVFDNYLIGYAPGNESHQFPADTGVYIPPGGEFLFQMHYTPVGRQTTDRSRIGLYFHAEKPDNFFRQDVVVNPMIRIPAQKARHAEVAYYAFDQAVLLHDMVPHAHYRGVASKFELWKPDGSKEVILSVPNYDFNWQRTYEFVEPKQVPAGTKLVHTTWYDNSAANPGNPDPTREVPWGLQSWDEMLYGAFSYTIVGETTESPVHDKLLARTTQFVGFLDQNIDGKLSWRELPKQLKKQLVQGFKAVDTNGDGGLDIQEMYTLSKRREEQKAADNDAGTGAADAR
jgi:AhpC/TSA family protein